MGHNGVAVAPFLNVLAQYKHPLTVDLVRYQQTLFPDVLGNERRLTAGCGTKVQNDTVRIDILL